MSDRRQSGLWSRNPETGFFEQIDAPPNAQIRAAGPYQPKLSPQGPYQYYQPPAQPRVSQSQSQSQSQDRRSFSDRTGVPRPPAESDARKKPRSNTLDAVQDATLNMNDTVKGMLNNHPAPTSEDLARTQHVNSAGRTTLRKQAPLAVDSDYAPTNLRSNDWSSDLMSPSTANTKPRQTSTTSSVSEAVRRGSIPDRGPLQSLESWSKEEKRAKLEQAEERHRQQSNTSSITGQGLTRQYGSVRSGKGRVVNDTPARRLSQPDRPRQVSAGATDPAIKFRNASDALKDSAPRVQQPSNDRHAVPIANQAKTYDRAPGQPRQVPTNQTPPDVGRSGSRKYRARDAGFVGGNAAAHTGPTIASYDESVERGKTAYERRKVQVGGHDPNSPISPMTPTFQESNREIVGVGRSGSKKLQKRPPIADDYVLREAAGGIGGGDGSRRDLQATSHPESAPRQSMDTNERPDEGVRYDRPPQTASAHQAREQVGFADAPPANAPGKDKQHRFGGLFHHRDHRGYQSTSKPLDDWRQGKPARLTGEDLDLDQAYKGASRKGNDAAWWEKEKERSSSGSSSKYSKGGPPDLAQVDGPYEETASGFQPRLFLKCGPLLRYTGIRRETVQGGQSSSGGSTRNVWRGSVMIVTEDDQSDLASTPTLRLFAQPMNLHQPPPQHVLDAGRELPPDFEDPVAGQVKLSRTGRALYVRPVAELAGDVDLSREENNRGLYSAQRTPLLGPQASIGTDGRATQHITFQDKSRIKKRDGEMASRYRETRAVKLYSDRGYTFWRFNLEIELGNRQTRVAYRINKGPAIGFWVPARGDTMNIMFHSCNGFSLSVDSHGFSGPDPLWRDALNRHQARPFHVMLGGGDQIYNDAAMRDTVLFREWLQTKNPQHKHEADFTTEMQEELEEFYLHRYSMWFSQGLFSMANSQIPMINIWDDHDIIDGFGSYPDHFMSTRVFSGLGAIAFKYYMLFQHQSLAAETEQDEPSWLLGPSPGPYIAERSRSIFLNLGPKLAFLGLDCRTERRRDEILSQETYDAVFDRCRTEIVKGEVKHLLVLLGVPIAYPRLNFLENILTSRVMDPIKAIGRTGMLGGFVNKFDGGVEILDDLDDHWTAKHHKAERNWFIQELQEVAAEKSVRITILGGDVHLAAIGQFYSNKKLGIPKDRDHRYMPNVVSSAIVNTPPPVMMADVLNKRNKIHHLDAETDEDMIPMFSHDVDRSKRNNNHLLPRRNFAIIREYVPGSTPPPSPKLEAAELVPRTSMDSAQQYDARYDEKQPRDRRFPPGSMKRTMSLTRGPASLVRRLSGSSKKGPPSISIAPENTRPYNDEDRRPSAVQRSSSLSAAEGRGYFAQGAVSDGRPSDTFDRRPSFKRRPTNLSEKQGRKASSGAGSAGVGDGAADEDAGQIDLEGGLDISLCMEVDQHDPSGTTVPYRLLVPALWYEGTGDTNIARFSSHRKSLMERLRFNRKREKHVDGAVREGDQYSDHRSDATRTPSPPPQGLEQSKHPPAAVNTSRSANRNPVPSPADALGLSNTGRGFTSNHSRGNNALAPRSNGLNGNPISQPHPNSMHAYNQGLNLSSPPIGQPQQPPHSAGLPPTRNGIENFPDSGHRRSSAPAVQPQQQQNRGPYQRSPPVGGADGQYSDEDGTYTESEDGYYDDEHEKPQRKGSKVERFFGIGGQRQGQGGDPYNTQEDHGEGKRKAGWKIWK